MKEYLEDRKTALGKIQSPHDLERAIGILSYCRRSVMAAGRIIGPLHQALKVVKEEGAGDWEWFSIEEKVKKAFELALEVVRTRKVLGQDVTEFQLYAD